MKRYISEKDEKHYTLMLKILKALDINNLDYNWLITDIVAYPTNSKYRELIKKNEYLFMPSDELLKMLNKEDFQWIWGVFSAIPKKYKNIKEITKFLPYADENTKIYDEAIIQHPLADIEIVAVDSSYVFIVAKDTNIANKFKELYPKSKEDF